MSAVVNLINSHRNALSLSTDADCLNGLGVNDMISYFEHKPVKYCVLVTDTDKIKAVLEQESGINLRLLQTADRNVGKFLAQYFKHLTVLKYQETTTGALVRGTTGKNYTLEGPQRSLALRYSVRSHGTHLPW